MTTHGNPLAIHFSAPPKRGRRPAIFLDRDGVINERVVGGYVTSWNEFRFLEGCIAALRELSRFNLPLIVVSNQAGVGKGLMSRADLRRITTHFVAHLARARIAVAAVYYCPHISDSGCRCRKPRPGLILQAARDWRVDLGRSVMIGDSPSDIEAARAAGCRSILFDPQGEVSTVSQPERGGPPPPAVFAVRRIADVPAQVTVLLERFLRPACDLNRQGAPRIS